MKRKQVYFRAAVRNFSASEPPEKKPKTEEIPQPSRVHPKQEQPSQPYSFRRALKKTYGEYCLASSIHGVPHVYQERRLLERLLWLLMILISLIICTMQVRMQYIRWRRTPVIITFSEKSMAVSQIPFPSITICSETKSVITESLNFTRFYYHLRSLRGQIITPPPWMSDEDFLKMRALLQVCGNYLVKDMHFPEYPPMSVTDQLNMIIPPFDTTLVFCSFNKSKGPCEPFFEKIYTEEGICYSFNALNESELYRKKTHQYEYFEKDQHIRKRNETLDWEITAGYISADDYDTYPERVIGSGPRAGLIIGLQGLEDNMDYVCRGPIQGFKLMLHSPDEIPHVDKHFIHIPYGRDVLILVQPHFVYTTDDIDQYSPQARHCYYPHERPLKFFQFYTQSNCEIECLTNFTLRTCGCVQFSMPRLSNTVVCDASQINCYEKAENDFLISEYTSLGDDVEECKCLPGCFTLKYNHEQSQGRFHFEKFVEAQNISMGESTNRIKVSRLRICFKNNEFTPWKRAKLYGITDFLANCGGLFGLFMGFSVLSIIEIFYFFTVRLKINVDEMKHGRSN